MPFVHEDVVFGVVGGNVFYGAELVNAATDFIGQGHGREDGYTAILKAYWEFVLAEERDQCMRWWKHTQGAAAADVDSPKASEGDREGDNVRSDVANHHDFVGVRGDKFAAHDGLECVIVIATLVVVPSCQECVVVQVAELLCKKQEIQRNLFPGVSPPYKEYTDIEPRSYFACAW